MNVIHAELLQGERGSVKFLLNDAAILFFPARQQHRDVKAHGLSYEDDYRGNAVAGMVVESRVEIRFHSAYSDERIRNLWKRVLQDPAMINLGLGKLLYQGREIL
jgi:hypothetical protein